MAMNAPSNGGSVVYNVTGTSGGGGGVTAHSALTGLAADDHSQYHTDARGDARYSLLAHNHTGTYQPLDPVLTATTASFTTADETKLDGLSNAVAMVGATAIAAGTGGLVPAPTIVERENFLRGDGTWQAVASGSAAVFDVQRFSGDGVTTSFNLSAAPGNENNTQVYFSGIYQQKDTYTVSGTTITFVDPPLLGTDNIEVTIIATVPVAVLSAGVTDHAGLTGLTLDDHPQYLTNARGDVRYQPLNAVLTATTASFTTADETKLNALAVMVGATAGTPSVTGTVPVAAAGDQNKLLTGAGTWVENTVMVGSSAGTAGVVGLVPASLAGDQNKFLKADGTWADGGQPLELYSITRKLNAVGQQGFTSTTPAAINLSSSTLNLTTGGFTSSLATGQITVTNAGNYQINFTVYFDDNAGTASGLNTYLAINGTDVIQSAVTADATFSGSTVINTLRALNAGDVLTLKAASTDGETLNLQGYDLVITQLGTSSYTTTNVYTGATAGTAGITGGVPAAAAGDQTKFLTGAGTWTTVPVPSYGSTTLATNLSVNDSAAAWVTRTGLSLSLPSAGTYRVFWSVSAELADAGTTEVALSGRLYNTTTATAYTQSTHLITGYDSPTASVSTRLGNGCGEAIVVITGANTIQFQTRMSAIASDSATLMSDAYARGTSYMSYVKLG